MTGQVVDWALRVQGVVTKPGLGGVVFLTVRSGTAPYTISLPQLILNAEEGSMLVANIHVSAGCEFAVEVRMERNKGRKEPN